MVEPGERRCRDAETETERRMQLLMQTRVMMRMMVIGRAGGRRGRRRRNRSAAVGRIQRHGRALRPRRVRRAGSTGHADRYRRTGGRVDQRLRVVVVNVFVDVRGTTAAEAARLVRVPAGRPGAAGGRAGRPVVAEVVRVGQ